MNDSERTARPSAMPSTQAKKPRRALGTFWLIIGVLLLVAGFTGNGWCVLLGIAAIAYAIYLYRGGRYGFWFLPF
jgi:1,4-dihydroxy-2-naphthoate octaprenyltransferase